MYYARPVSYAIACNCTCVQQRNENRWNRWPCYENDDNVLQPTIYNVVKPMTMIWNRRLLVVKSSAWHPHPHSITTPPTPPPHFNHTIDDNVMKPMTMIWSRNLVIVKSMTMFSMTSTSSFHHTPPPPHFNHTTNRWQCYENDDNVMKPMTMLRMKTMTMLWNRWQCYETEDNLSINSCPHQPTRPFR